MRPQCLTQLFASLESLPGIAGRTAKALGRLGMKRVRDLAFHLPSGINEYPLRTCLQECMPEQTAAVIVRVIEHVPKPNARQPYKVICEDRNGMLLHLVFFHAYYNTIIRQFPLNSEKLVAGTIEHFMGQYQMAHPEKVWPASRADAWQETEPSYPLTAGVGQGQMQKFVNLALDRLPDLPEWIPQDILKAQQWPTWRESLLHVHAPQDESDLERFTPAHRRLAFDELLSHQLGLSLVRQQTAKAIGCPRSSEGALAEKILATCGFQLTGAQTQVLSEITRDLASPHPMTRLLQGDVGSGKTLVGVLAMGHVIEAGYQAAMLVPTEVLAQQHYLSISKLVEGTDIHVALLTGRIKGKARQKIYEQLANGEIHLIIGTHALIQDTVEFQNLGLVIIDEQHRFGVEQRAKLSQKGKMVDLLVMTATPIPRTLMLTSYGDLDVSRMYEKPKGRKDIRTNVISLKRLNEVYEGIKRVIEKGEQVYWVCPLVEESEALDLAAATERYEDLIKWFGVDNVGLVHGQMKGPDKDQAMDAFKNGNTQILVSTTVIEVGVDVPQATVIVIEHAERFGLSQLHQLRGRVGRNDLECSCLLLYGPNWSAATKARFQVMRETNDGFRIAEEDLKLRGGGDLLGTKQSGLPSYRFADVTIHFDLLRQAHELARELIAVDPQLTNEALKILTYLFNHDTTVPDFKVAA